MDGLIPIAQVPQLPHTHELLCLGLAIAIALTLIISRQARN